MEVNDAETRLGHGDIMRLGILKQRMLLQRLADTPESEIHALIIRQAEEAAFLACLTVYPLLVFPCLFEEKAAAATARALCQAHRYWTGLRPQLPACAA